MERHLERVLSVKTPLTTGAIVMNDIDLCIGYRGELAEKDASPIADLITRATDNAEEFKGQVRYKQKRLQFHKTPDYTFALLRSDTPPPVSTPSTTSMPSPDPQSLTLTSGMPSVASPAAASFGTQGSSGTLRGRTGVDVRTQELPATE